MSVEHRARGYAMQQDIHTLIFACNTDGCNNVTTLKRIINALTLTENLNELESLLAPGSYPSFTEQKSCLNISNAATTNQCTPGASSMSNCVGCQIQMKSNIFCAQCAPRFSIRIDDYMLRSKIFFFDNHTQIENIELFCRVKGCNALSSIDKIRQASTLEFNFDRFFNGTFPSSSSGHLLQTINIYLIMFIIIIGQRFHRYNSIM
ncbi:unnamed protein product [Rotaria sp. Silwood2]|nr:unnamed protein product [Rotaria sp. Silwood2]